MADINFAMGLGKRDLDRATKAMTVERTFDTLHFAHSGTPGSCLDVRIVSEVFTLATLGAGVSLLVRNS